MRIFAGMDGILIRRISARDNYSIAQVIREALAAYDAPKAGSAMGDPELDYMDKAYSLEKHAYFIAELNGEIVGGAGVAPLENATADICELRKMYLDKRARGKGIGARLMQACLDQARSFGFQSCYLETFPAMAEAQKLYVKSGFEYLDAPMGGTGHTACSIWMLKKLGYAD